MGIEPTSDTAYKATALTTQIDLDSYEWVFES